MEGTITYFYLKMELHINKICRETAELEKIFCLLSGLHQAKATTLLHVNKSGFTPIYFSSDCFQAQFENNQKKNKWVPELPPAKIPVKNSYCVW